MEKNILYIMLNRACNCACEICYTESNPECFERLDYELLKKFILSALEDKDLKQIVFTGGEPFYYYEDLKKYISLASKTGKSIACMTNGFWGEDEQLAYEKLTELKKSGLRELIISYDYYHSKYIVPKTINNAIKAAHKADIETHLCIINAKNHAISEWMDQIEDIDMISKTLFRSCIPEGNAKKNLSEEDYTRSITPDTQICHSTNKILIKYDGTIMPCIHPGMFNGGINIGNYQQLSYQQAKQKIEDDVLIQTLCNYGFDLLIECAKKELDIPIPDKIISNCELCQILFSKENAEKFYKYFNMRNQKQIMNIS